MSENMTCNCSADITACPEQLNETCPATGYQEVNVCVPVTITPFAHAGVPCTRCCGEPVVIPDDTTCAGTVNGICTLTISQTLCVEVPINFGASVAVGETFVDCRGASSYDPCAYCRAEEEEI